MFKLISIALLAVFCSGDDNLALKGKYFNLDEINANYERDVRAYSESVKPSINISDIDNIDQGDAPVYNKGAKYEMIETIMDNSEPYVHYDTPSPIVEITINNN